MSAAGPTEVEMSKCNLLHDMPQLALRHGNPFDDLCAEASSSVTSQAAMDSSCLEPQAWPFCASLCCTVALLVSSSDDVLYEMVVFV